MEGEEGIYQKSFNRDSYHAYFIMTSSLTPSIPTENTEKISSSITGRLYSQYLFIVFGHIFWYLISYILRFISSKLYYIAHLSISELLS